MFDEKKIKHFDKYLQRYFINKLQATKYKIETC